MNYLKSEIGKRHLSKCNLSWYNLKEYLGLYDIKDSPGRLKSLKDGAILYFDFGYSFYQFHRFHHNKERIYSWLNYTIIVFFLLFSILVYAASEVLLLSILIIFSGLVLRRVLISPAISANILHVNKLLEGPNGMLNLKTLLNSTPEDDSKHNYFMANICFGHSVFESIIIRKTTSFIDDDNFDGELDSKDFVNQLIKLGGMPNKFNSMPMNEVIDFFSVMCCNSCKMEIPQMSQTDFIKFLENGFINPYEHGKIQLSMRKLMVTYQIFHQFYIISYNKMYSKKDDHVDRYISLLTSQFEGFNINKVRNNFRTNDDYFLLDLREKYKIDLQNLQSIQTMKKVL